MSNNLSGYIGEIWNSQALITAFCWSRIPALYVVFKMAAEVTRVDWIKESGGIHRDDLYDSLCKTTSQHDEDRIRFLPP